MHYKSKFVQFVSKVVFVSFFVSSKLALSDANIIQPLRHEVTCPAILPDDVHRLQEQFGFIS